MTKNAGNLLKIIKNNEISDSYNKNN